MQAVHQLAESKVMVRRWLHISAALDTNDAAPAVLAVPVLAPVLALVLFVLDHVLQIDLYASPITLAAAIAASVLALEAIVILQLTVAVILIAMTAVALALAIPVNEMKSRAQSEEVQLILPVFSACNEILLQSRSRSLSYSKTNQRILAYKLYSTAPRINPLVCSTALCVNACEMRFKSMEFTCLAFTLR